MPAWPKITSSGVSADQWAARASVSPKLRDRTAERDESEDRSGNQFAQAEIQVLAPLCTRR